MVITTVFPMYMEIALAKEKKKIKMKTHTYRQINKNFFYVTYTLDLVSTIYVLRFFKRSPRPSSVE